MNPMLNLRIFTVFVFVLVAAVAAPARSGRNRRSAPAPQPAAAPPVAAPAEPKPVPRAAPVPYIANFKVKYAGGSLGLKDGADVRIDIRDGQLTFKAEKLDVTVVGDRVTDVSYGQRVRKRTAEAVGASVIIPGIGGIIGDSKSTAHYIEIVWGGAPIGGLAMRVDKNDYQKLIDALEATTGLKVRLEPEPLIRDVP
ncbi:MAG: hypothetical protein IPF53_17140 [Blastocatellia bacterium]|nr:hypothetical protein [Blastocatellia bacterium]